MFAAMFGRAEVLAFLIESKKVDVARRDSQGRTALALAEQQERKDVVALHRDAVKPKDRP
jgi:ankyrin repeat protein